MLLFLWYLVSVLVLSSCTTQQNDPSNSQAVLYFQAGNSVVVEAEDIQYFFHGPFQFITHSDDSHDSIRKSAFLVNSTGFTFFSTIRNFYHFVKTNFKSEMDCNQLKSIIQQEYPKIASSEDAFTTFYHFAVEFIPFTQKVPDIEEWITNLNNGMSMISDMLPSFELSFNIWYRYLRLIIPFVLQDSFQIANDTLSNDFNIPQIKMEGTYGKCNKVSLKGRFYNNNYEPKELIFKSLKFIPTSRFSEFPYDTFYELSEMTNFQFTVKQNTFLESYYNIPKAVVIKSLAEPIPIGYLTDYENGGDLYQFLQKFPRGQFKFDRYFFEQMFSVAKGLHELHSAGMYHLDISESNIFVSVQQDSNQVGLNEQITDTGNILSENEANTNIGSTGNYKFKLGDFGLSCCKDTLFMFNHLTDKKYTRYPPETFTDMKDILVIGPHTDWYEFGKLLMYLGEIEISYHGSCAILTLLHPLITYLTEDSIIHRWGWNNISGYFEYLLNALAVSDGPWVAINVGAFKNEYPIITINNYSKVLNAIFDTDFFREQFSSTYFFIGIGNYLTLAYPKVLNWFVIEIPVFYEYIGPADIWITSEITNGVPKVLRNRDILTFQKEQLYSVCFCTDCCQCKKRVKKCCAIGIRYYEVIERIEKFILQQPNPPNEIFRLLM